MKLRAGYQSRDEQPDQRLWKNLGYGGKTASHETWRYWPQAGTGPWIIAAPLEAAEYLQEGLSLFYRDELIYEAKEGEGQWDVTWQALAHFYGGLARKLARDVPMSTRTWMDNLDDILREATAAVDPSYFTLDIAGGEAVFRERVYCYELYHQMRQLWPPKHECRFLLSGEVDKSGHMLLQELGADGTKPDLLVHRPGYMEDNFAIIEVKHSIALEGVRKDLKTLDLFMRKVEYKRAIYLIYGRLATEKAAAKIATEAKELTITTPIEVWLQPECGKPATLFSKLAGPHDVAGA